MAAPVSFAGWTYNDSTQKSNGAPETASFSVAIPTLTAGNLVATVALVQALEDAVEDIVLGNLGKRDITYQRLTESKLPAADQMAQREIKLLCRYEGASTHKSFRVEIPTFDLSLLPLHSEFLDLTAGVGAALKTAWEAVVKSPDDAAEATVLLSAQFVGRNS